MGTVATPAYASLLVAHWHRHKSIQNKDKTVEKGFRLCFGMAQWKNSKYFRHMWIQVALALKFTVEYNLNTINFLDLTIFKHQDGSIHTSIYRKSMERNTLLHHNSNPNHLKQNIPKGQFLPLRRNCSELDEFKCKAGEMKSRFYKRNDHVTVINQSPVNSCIQMIHFPPCSDESH